MTMEMVNKEISSLEVDELLSKIKSEMALSNLPKDMIDGTRIVVIHPEYWEISLLVPYPTKGETVKSSIVRKTVEGILFKKCNANPQGCDYFGKRPQKKAYEWYLRHPKIPQEINDLIEAEIEEDLGKEIGLGLPSPSGKKSNSDTAFITVKDVYFKEIERGVKTEEYRNLNQYYCDKFFSPGVKKKFLRINRGYLTGAENQMTFEIAGINIVNEQGNVEVPAVDNTGKLITSFTQLPKRFAPAAYGIKLGRRIN